jgi:hypothetical protein
MEFKTMASWAICPQYNCDLNKTHIINPKTLYMLPRHVYTIDLGIMLTRIPNNTVVIIQNTLPTSNILNKFWIASNALLTLTIIAEHYTVLSRGERLCSTYILPVECFLPGNYKHCMYTVVKPFIFTVSLFLVPTTLAVQARKSIQYYGKKILFIIIYYYLKYKSMLTKHILF